MALLLLRCHAVEIKTLSCMVWSRTLRGALQGAIASHRWVALLRRPHPVVGGLELACTWQQRAVLGTVVSVLCRCCCRPWATLAAPCSNHVSAMQQPAALPCDNGFTWVTIVNSIRMKLVHDMCMHVHVNHIASAAAGVA